MRRSLDSYEAPKAYKKIKEKAWNAVYTAHYLDACVDEFAIDTHKNLVASLAQIAHELEKLGHKEEPPMKLVLCVDDSRVHANTATWCVLVYADHEGIQYKLFMATKNEWEHNILTNIRENFFGLVPDYIPILVARSRYTFSRQQILDYLATESGRRDLLYRYSEVKFVATDDKGRKTLKEFSDLTNDDNVFLDRYTRKIFGKDEECND